MKTTYSVETEPSSYMDDLFNGTFEECIEYCKEHDYTPENCGARIAKILVDDEGSVAETLDIIEDF